MRHMMRVSPTVTHILPLTMKAMPRNIFFSPTSVSPASASRTLFVNAGFTAILLSTLRCKFLECQRVEQDDGGNDPIVSHFEPFIHHTIETPAIFYQRVVHTGAGRFIFGDKSFYFQR